MNHVVSFVIGTLIIVVLVTSFIGLIRLGINQRLQDKREMDSAIKKAIAEINSNKINKNNNLR